MPADQYPTGGAAGRLVRADRVGPHIPPVTDTTIVLFLVTCLEFRVRPQTAWNTLQIRRKALGSRHIAVAQPGTTEITTIFHTRFEPWTEFIEASLCVEMGLERGLKRCQGGVEMGLEWG